MWKLSWSLLLVVLVGCGPMLEPAEGPMSESPSPVEPPGPRVGPLEARAQGSVHLGEAPFLSRYSPTVGLPGTRIRVLGSGFSPVLLENVVTVGGAQATPVEGNEGYLEVLLGDGSQSGPLMVTVGTHTVSGTTFTVLEKPVVYGSSPAAVAAGSGDTVLLVGGEGLDERSTVLLDGNRLETTVDSGGQLRAVAPAWALAARADARLTVYTQLRRCSGVESDPVTLRIH